MPKTARKRKSMVSAFIYRILQQHTDPSNKVTLAEVHELLKREYGIDIDLKTVRGNLITLSDSDIGIQRTDKEKGKGQLYWYEEDCVEE